MNDKHYFSMGLTKPGFVIPIIQNTNKNKHDSKHMVSLAWKTAAFIHSKRVLYL